MDYKLIALDMDGTLLNSKKEITEQNKEAISKAMAQGVKIVLNSGRAYDGIAYAYKELGISGADQYMINSGGNIIESLDKKIIYKKVMENNTCENIARDLKSEKINYVLIDIEGNSYDSYQEWMEKRMLNTNLAIAKFMIHTHKRNLEETAEKLHQKYDAKFFVVVTSKRDIEIFPKEVNKGKALEKLAKHLKIKQEQVVAIGDLDNDIPMIKFAGLGVAMGNSPENVKIISDEVTADDNHSGVGQAIEKYVLK